MRSLFSAIANWPRPARIGLYALACCILLYLTLAPGKDVPGEGIIWDKAEHALSWAVLTGAGLVLSTRRRWAVGVFAFTFGAAIEVMQATLPFGRDGDWHDLLADSVGIVAAFLVWFGMRRLGWTK